VRNGDDDNWDDWDDDEDGRNKDEFDIKIEGGVTYSTFATVLTGWAAATSDYTNRSRESSVVMSGYRPTSRLRMCR